MNNNSDMSFVNAMSSSSSNCCMEIPCSCTLCHCYMNKGWFDFSDVYYIISDAYRGNPVDKCAKRIHRKILRTLQEAELNIAIAEEQKEEAI